MKNKKLYKYVILVVLLVVVGLLATKVIFFRIDLTDDKRYSISENSKNVLRAIDEQIDVDIYLTDADANLAKLKRSVNDMLDEFSAYSAKNINYRYIDPSEAPDERTRQEQFYQLEERGMSPITVSTRDGSGKVSQAIVFPWAEVSIGEGTLPVSLMKPTGMRSGEESVNAATEELEYNFIDAIRILGRESFDKIAFLEGHGELSEIETYSLSEHLSRYFQIDRGKIGNDASELQLYKAVIIAKPTEEFSESDKFVIDQYIMHGGKVVWLIDAIRYSTEELTKTGMSPAMPLELNLGDMLFRYGVRVEPAVVQDLQCLQMPVNVAMPGEPPIFEQVPYPYSPLLMTSPESPITKNLMNVKSDFPSFVQQVSIENGIEMQLLLASSPNSHVDMAPTNIDLRAIASIDPEKWINAQYAPVGVIMEGEFQSVFAHRQTPANLTNTLPRRDKSPRNQMIVVADGDIARNDVDYSSKKQIGIIPLGLDRTNGQVYGNASFLVNAILSMTDDQSLIELRNRTLKLRMLDKQKISTQRTAIQAMNVALPLLILAVFGGVFLTIRRRLYRK